MWLSVQILNKSPRGTFGCAYWKTAARYLPRFVADIEEVESKAAFRTISMALMLAKAVSPTADEDPGTMKSDMCMC